MLASPSSQWSGSAGSIYPLMVRLRKAGLLSAKAERRGNRRRREYTITPEGMAILRAWMGPPMSPEVLTVAHDPLRSRARFLEALTPAQQRAWVKAARDAIDEVERRVRAWEGKHSGLGIGAAITHASGELDVSSRRSWLNRVERVLEGAEPSTSRTPPAPAREGSSRRDGRS